jgi:type II secretory pathway component GspD/PulD (secretin)
MVAKPMKPSRLSLIFSLFLIQFASALFSNGQEPKVMGARRWGVTVHRADGSLAERFDRLNRKHGWTKGIQLVSANPETTGSSLAQRTETGNGPEVPNAIPIPDSDEGTERIEFASLFNEVPDARELLEATRELQLPEDSPLLKDESVGVPVLHVVEAAPDFLPGDSPRGMASAILGTLRGLASGITDTVPDASPAQVPENEKLVTLHMNEVDIVRILETFSRSYGMSIIIAPEVQGTVTANFEGVPADIALQSLLKLCKLASYQDQGLLYVYPADGLPVGQRPLRLFILDFVKAEQILPAVVGLLSPSGKAFISEIDPKNNRRSEEAIVVVDDFDSVARVEQYLSQVDQPPRQVMIEANVLEIKLSDELRHGVNFDQILGGDLGLQLTGTATPSAPSAFFAKIQGSKVQALVEALQTTVDTRTLATPKVMVINGQLAKLQVGSQLGFKVVTVTQTATIEDVRFMDIGVVLAVTPQISRDNRVMLHVKPEVSTGRINPTTLLPEEETRELETSVLLTNGQGVVIGGLIQDKDDVTIKKVPFLGDCYMIGLLFQRRETKRDRSEIIVTLVPRIVDFDCNDCSEEGEQLERATTRLLYPNLNRIPRPEPRIKDAARRPR